MEAKEEELKTWLKLIKSFMDQFGWLADAFVLDFFVNSHWERLPMSWSQFLPRLTPEMLADLIDPQSHGAPCPDGAVPPLSLLAFKSSVQLLSFQRTFKVESFEEVVNNISVETVDSGLKDFKNLFRRHVKLKKRHEVEQMGKIVSRLSVKTGATQVYDVGSGLGHLSRYLTYEHGLKLKCVDKEQQFGVNASKFDTELESFLAKKNIERDTLPDPPTHENILLQFDNVDGVFNASDKFGFTGLHSCGNLSPLILHNYFNSSANFVVSLGCCYMKMDAEGFPMADFTKSTDLKFSYEALEVACHAIEQYCQRLRLGQAKKLITHCYRATLETLLVPHGLKHVGLRSVPRTETLTFVEYALRATSCLPVKFDESDLSKPQVTSKLEDWFKVVLFYSLRLMLAQVIETAVLIDRCLFVTSPSTRTFLIPCFDPFISPRNIGIVSLKK